MDSVERGDTTSPNGLSAESGQGSPLASLRSEPDNVHLLGGFGPLVVGIILFLLIVTLAPTVAPEHVVERPVDAPAGQVAP